MSWIRLIVCATGFNKKAAAALFGNRRFLLFAYSGMTSSVSLLLSSLPVCLNPSSSAIKANVAFVYHCGIIGTAVGTWRSGWLLIKSLRAPEAGLGLCQLEAAAALGADIIVGRYAGTALGAVEVKHILFNPLQTASHRTSSLQGYMKTAPLIRIGIRRLCYAARRVVPLLPEPVFLDFSFLVAGALCIV